MAEDYTKVRQKKERERYGSMPKRELKELKDGKQAGEVFTIRTDTEKADLGRMRYHSVGNKGYAGQAFDYDY